MKIAIVGAGIFGISIAVKLAQSGYNVDLFEKEDDILKAASGVNQFRLHRGYHYPRSNDTTKDSLRTEVSFRKEYPDVIVDDRIQYYCIAKEKSLILAEKYLNFCKRFDLEFKLTKPKFLNHDNIAVCLRAKEGRIDPAQLKKTCRLRIKKYRINLKLNTPATPATFKKYDFVVLCTYASLNSLLSEFSEKQREYQYELCEKPVVKLPPVFKNQGVVIMDGPFMCVDPLGRTDKFLFGNVVHAIHQTNIGLYPEIDDRFLPLLNNGVIKNPSITNFDKFVESGKYFFPKLTEAEHIGSMFTIRTVLPYKEKTDERPTMITKINDKIVTVFSGKFSNCVEAAERVLDLVKEV